MAKSREGKGIRNLWIFGLLALLCVLVFWPMFRNGFVWDDTWFIVKNPAIRRLSPPAWLLGCPGPGAPWLGMRPVTALFFALDYAIWRDNIWGFHLTNLLLHLICTLGIFWLAEMVFKKKDAAFAAAALFAVHPGHGEAVVAFIGRSDLLATTFLLLASLFYLLSFQGRQKLLCYGLSVASFLLGCFSKETALAFFGILLLLEGIRERKGSWGRALLRVTPFLVVVLLYAVYRLHTPPGPPNTGHPWLNGPVGVLAAILWDFAEYLRLFLLPTLFYVDLPARAPFGIETILGGVGLILCLGAFVVLWKRSHRQAFGLGWFLLGLAPLLLGWALPLVGLKGLGKLPGPLPAERWFYLPSVGACLAVGLAFAIIREKVGHVGRTALAMAGVVAVILLAWRENSLVPVWRTDESVALATPVTSSNAPFTYNYLGNVLLVKGEETQAIAAFRRASELDPNYPQPHVNLGVILRQQGRQTEAEEEYREALRLNPNGAEAHYNLGVLLGIQGKTEEAIAEYRKVVLLNPGNLLARYNLGGELCKEGKVEEGIGEFREVIRLKPDYVLAHYAMGISLGQEGKQDEAISEYREAVRLKPDFAEAHNSLGLTLYKQGHLAEAIASYREAIRLKPDYCEAFENLAKALDSLGSRKEAREFWLRAEKVEKRPEWIKQIKYRLALPD